MKNSYMETDFDNLGAAKRGPLFDSSFPENHMDDNGHISKFEEESIPSGYEFQQESTLKEPISIDDWIQPWDPDGTAHQDALSFNLDSAINYNFDHQNTTNPVPISATAPVSVDSAVKESESVPMSVTPDGPSHTAGVLRNGSMSQNQRSAKVSLTPQKETSPISYPALKQFDKDIGLVNGEHTALTTENLSSADGQEVFSSTHSGNVEDVEGRHQREISTAYTMKYPLVSHGFNDTSAQHVNPHSIMKTPVRNAHRFLNMSPDLSSPNASFAGLESPLCSPSQNQSPFVGDGTFTESFPATANSKSLQGNDPNFINFAGTFESPRASSTASSSEGPSRGRSMSTVNSQPSQASRARSIDISVYSNESLESQFTPTTPKSILQSRKQSIGTPKRTLTTVINDDHLADQALATPKSLAGNTTQATPRTGKKDARRRIGKEQTEALENFYAINPKPERDDREKLAGRTGLEVRTVQIWFQNRRAKSRSMKNSMNAQEGGNTDNNIAIENSVAAQRAISANSAESKAAGEKSQIVVPSAAAAAAAAAANGFISKEGNGTEALPTSKPNARGSAHVTITPKTDTMLSRAATNASNQGILNAAKPQGFSNPPAGYFANQTLSQNTPEKGNSKTSADLKPRTRSNTPHSTVPDQGKGMFSRKPRNSRTALAPFPPAPLYPKEMDVHAAPQSWEGRKPFPYPPGAQLPGNPYYMDYMAPQRQVYPGPIKPIPPPLVRSQSLPMYRNQKGRQPIPMPLQPQVATAPYQYPGQNPGEPIDYYDHQPMVSPMDAQYNPHLYPPNHAPSTIDPSENDPSMGFKNASGFDERYYAEMGPEAQSMNQPAWNWKYRMPFEPPAVPGSDQNLSPPEMKKRRPTSMSLPFYGLGEPPYFGDMNTARHSSSYSGVSTASSSNSDLSYTANPCTTPSRSLSRIRSNTQPSHRARQPSVRLQMDDSSSSAQLIVINDDEN